jgi:DNA polymerase-1
MLGAYVLDPAGNFDLPRLVARYMNEVYTEEIPEAYYAMAVYKEIAPVIDEREQHNLLFDIEMPLARVLADMEIAGFRVDIGGLNNYGEQLGKLEKEAEERIYCYAGEEFNVNSPKQLGEVLFEKLMLPNPGKKTKTGYSTNAEVLEKMRPYHPIIEEILEYRKVAKLKSTYTDGLVKAADSDGRVRTNFKQTGTATGRLSSTEPNLQNIPIRTELGRELRRYFLPENRDYVLLDADYSQIELRLLSDISKDENMISAFLGGEDIHTSTAAAVFGVSKDAVTGEQRKRAKAVNFGIVYGIGAFSLASDLGISRAKANEYIENYLASYPGVRDYLKNVVKDAYANGYVTTPLGRRRYIPELAGQNKNLKNFGERVAMNSPIQGSAADIIKIAMINVSRKLRESGFDARLILQVHDELLIEAKRDDADKVAKILQTEMENAVDIAVPLVAEVTVGENWFDNK